MICAATIRQALVAIPFAVGLLLSPGNASASWSSQELRQEVQRAPTPGEAALALHRLSLLEPGEVDAPVDPAVVPPASPRTLAAAWYAGMAMGLLGVGWLVAAGRRRVALALSGVGLSLATVAAVPLSRLSEARDLAIVVESAPLRLSPAEAAPETRALDEGTAVRIERERGDFVEIADARGTGWVPADRLARVVP